MMSGRSCWSHPRRDRVSARHFLTGLRARRNHSPTWTLFTLRSEGALTAWSSHLYAPWCRIAALLGLVGAFELREHALDSWVYAWLNPRSLMDASNSASAIIKGAMPKPELAQQSEAEAQQQPA